MIDDASHLYHPTVTTFELLFPRIRKGGRFVIEDWATGALGSERVLLGFPGAAAVAYKVYEALRASPLFDDTIVVLDGQTFLINYNDGDGFDVTLTAIAADVSITGLSAA